MFQNRTSQDSHESASYTVLSGECSYLLDTLGNSTSRTILKETTDTARTIDELLETCEMSQTTIYRRVNELLDLNLLEESVHFAEGNQQQRQFRTTGNEITLRIGPEGFEAHIGSTGPEPSAEGLLMDKSSQHQLRIALSGKDLHCRIESDGGPDATESESAE